MGQSLKDGEFTAEQYATFHNRLEDELDLLKQTLKDPKFDQNIPSMGAELEMYLTDSDWQPTPKIEWLLNECNNPLLQPELNQYNLEFNLAPLQLRRAIAVLGVTHRCVHGNAHDDMCALFHRAVI